MIWLLTKIWPIAVFAGLLINEVSYKGTPEWVELFNDSEQSSELSGLILKDANNSSKDDLILDGSISPHEYKIFENSKSWLNDTGDTLFLISSSSGQILDQITFEKATEGKTYGRTKDSWSFMEPSKGGVNSATTENVLTSTPTITQTSEPTRTSTPTTPPTIKPTTVITTPPKPTAQVSMVATPSSEVTALVTPEVLGETESTKPAEIKEEKKTSDNFPYGYLLMLGGSMTSIVGLGIGYLRHHHDSVK